MQVMFCGIDARFGEDKSLDVWLFLMYSDN